MLKMHQTITFKFFAEMNVRSLVIITESQILHDSVNG